MLEVDLRAKSQAGANTYQLEPHDKPTVIGVTMRVRNHVVVKEHVWRWGDVPARAR